MGNRFDGLNLTAQETEWFCRGLMDLANSDGVHESEIEIIEEFYADGKLDDAAVKGLLEEGFSTSDAKAHLQGDTLDAFMTTCFLLAYADGQLSNVEESRLNAYAEAFDYDATKMSQAHDEARQFLIRSLAEELKNHALVREIGAAIGLSEAKINAALAGGN